MISTTYTTTSELEDDGVTTLTLQVSVIDEVIGVNEGYKNTVKSKLVITLPSGYSESDVDNAVIAEGFDL